MPEYNEVPTTTEPETEETTTEPKVEETTEPQTTAEETTTVSSSTSQPVTGYARRTLFAVIILGLFALIGGAVLTISEKKSRA